MGGRRGKPVKLGDGIEGLFRKDALRDGLNTARVVEAWEEVVGEQISRRTRGVSLTRGTLLVTVDSHAWATELESVRETLKSKVNSVLGETSVREIRFTVSRKSGDLRREEHRVEEFKRGYGEPRIEPVALTASEKAAIEESVSGIRNSSLRQAAIRATERDLEWKKGQRSEEKGDTAPGEAVDTKTGLLP